MGIDLTEIAVSVIGLIGVIITAYAVPRMKALTCSEQHTMLAGAARTAVFAAQQIFETEAGEKKKEYALEYLHNMLKSKCITVSEEEISAAVEAALKEIKLSLEDIW